MFKERLKTHHSAMHEGKKYIRGMGSVIETLQKPNVTRRKDKATIYIHVPFCSKICTFCNMQRKLQTADSKYHVYVIKEILQYAKLPYIQDTIFDAIYFGGGTPTSLSTAALKEILEALKVHFNLSENVEVTIETTLTELTDEKLEMFQKTIVNRLSIGVQTFHDEARKRMARKGDGKFAYERVQEIRAKTDAIISLDLIYNYANQTKEGVLADIKKISDLQVDGFSLYSLINLQDTSIDAAQQLEIDLEMFQTIATYMEEQGYRFLELTKMVKKDQYKYIMNRHQGSDTLPLGAGAGGSVNGIMMMNPIVLKEYYNSVKYFDKRKGMCFDPTYKEITVFKGDMQSLYLPRQEALYANIEAYQETLQRLLEDGYVVKKEQGYHFTHKGIFWGNSISRLLSSYLDI